MRAMKCFLFLTIVILLRNPVFGLDASIKEPLIVASSESSSESGKESSSSASKESGVDSDVSQSNHSNSASSAATTESSTEHSSEASSESGLVPVGGRTVPPIPSGVPPADGPPANPAQARTSENAKAPLSGSKSQQSPAHAVVKNYKWSNGRASGQ